MAYNKEVDYNANLLSNEYASWLQELMEGAWTGYFMTFKFCHLKMSSQKRLLVMRSEIERVFSTFVPHCVRRPRASNQQWLLPRFFGFPDLPVQKGKAGRSDSALVNGGLHWHGIMLIHAAGRLTVPLDHHFSHYARQYIRPDRSLAEIDVRLIWKTPGRAVRYATKQLVRGRFNIDEILVLPKTRAEIAGRKYR